METIQDRGYVWKKGTALVPSFTAFAVITLLEQHFADLVDYAFTRDMEDDLDDIASGDGELVPCSRTSTSGPTATTAPATAASRSWSPTAWTRSTPRAINSITIGVDPDGTPVVAKPGRYGPYLQRGDDTATIPTTCRPPSSPSSTRWSCSRCPRAASPSATTRPPG